MLNLLHNLSFALELSICRYVFLCYLENIWFFPSMFLSDFGIVFFGNLLRFIVHLLLFLSGNVWGEYEIKWPLWWWMVENLCWYPLYFLTREVQWISVLSVLASFLFCGAINFIIWGYFLFLLFGLFNFFTFLFLLYFFLPLVLVIKM